MKALVGLALAAALAPSFAAFAQSSDQAYAGSKSFCSKRWSGLPSTEKGRFTGEAPFMNLCTLACMRQSSNESSSAYEDRSHSLCQIRWDRLTALNATAGWTHSGFIDACSRKCAVADSASKPVIAGLVVGAGVGIGLAASGTFSSKAASP